MRGSPAWIEIALAEMERRGVPVGIPGRHLVDRLFAHEKAWTAGVLADALTALFARSAEERVAVREAVAAFAPAVPRPAGERAPAERQPTRAAATSGGSRATPGPLRRLRLQTIVAGALLALGAGGYAALVLRDGREPVQQLDAGVPTDDASVASFDASVADDAATAAIDQAHKGGSMKQSGK